MSQNRFLNFGTTADAAKTKSICQQLFAPQVLRADAPFFSAVAPDQLLISPHAVIFQNGLVLVEDEVITKVVATGYSSANYTLYYEHIDEDIIGGTAAVLYMVSGLLSTIENGVIIGWVVYPGGTVPLDGSMLYVNWQGQVSGERNFPETVIQAANNGSVVTAATSAWVSDNIDTLMEDTIPPGLQLDYSNQFASKKLSTANQKIRVVATDTNQQFSRIATAPGSGEYNLSTSGILTFNTLDTGRPVAICDLTYGPKLRYRYNTSAVKIGYVDFAVTFPVNNVPTRTLFFEYVILTGYTIDPIEIIDVNGDIATYLTKKTEPTDGQVARMSVRLLDGIFTGTSGEAFTVLFRATLAPSGSGVDLRVRASAYDLPM